MNRRIFVAGGVSLGAAAALYAQRPSDALLSSAAVRYADPATELEVLRLTDPAYASVLPAAHLRFISRRQGTLLYSSLRTGSMQIYRMDLKTYQTRVAGTAAELDPKSVTMLPDERTIVCFDGRKLKVNDLAVYELPADAERAPGFAVSEDGSTAYFVERHGSRSKLIALRLARGKGSALPSTVLETADAIEQPMVRGRNVLVRRPDISRIEAVNLDNRRVSVLATQAGGRTGPARWAPRGSTVLYLHQPDDSRQLVTLNETGLDGKDRAIAKTSQFAAFDANGDASVFAGASRSLASPYILILVRAAGRELSLCEHRASDPALVSPVFAPDSQSIFFQSDRHGKQAIYRVRVERFVEETDEGRV